MGKETSELFGNTLAKIENLYEQSADRYPFLTALKEALDLLREVVGKPYTYFLTELAQWEERLPDAQRDPIGSYPAVYER